MVETDSGMQLDLFDMLYEDFKFDKNKPIRLIETFAGIGTQKMGFERAGIDVDVVAIVEVDKHAVLSYAAMHTDYLEVRDTWFNDKDIAKDTMVKTLQNKMLGYDFKNDKHTINERNNIEIVRDFYLADHLSKNLGDISKVKGGDLPKGIDMLTYSFPCTDLSKAGQQKGLTDTRSGLVYQVFRIVEELKAINNQPKTLLMENVVDLIQKKFINEFHEMQLEVESYGYMNYTMRLNAKDFGVAQNRDRVFMLSIPRNHNYTEPKPFKLEKKLKDYLEDDVDEKYYLSDTFIRGMSTNSSDKYDRASRFETSVRTADDWSYSTAITTREGNVATSTFIKEPNAKTELCNKMIANGHLKESDMIRHSYTSERMENIERVESTEGISATLTTRPDTLGVVVKDCIAIKENTKKGYDIATLGDSVNLDQPNSKTRRGRVGKGLANTLTTSCNQGVLEQNLRIRKLTALECWRLMSVDDEYFYKAQQVNSNSQLYKQAGNAIVVDVFANIVKSLI